MNFVFYAGTVLIWGTTWLAITFQLGVVDPMISVIYRFALAAALLQVYLRVAGLRMRFALREHLYIALQGTLLFALNYWIFYAAELYLTSGLVAVVFSTIVFQNILFGALLLGDPIRPRVVFGASLGLVGIGLVFWPELSSFNLSDHSPCFTGQHSRPEKSKGRIADYPDKRLRNDLRYAGSSCYRPCRRKRVSL
jgi:drug/metabolite transporter (DMT)-like permease